MADSLTAEERRLVAEAVEHGRVTVVLRGVWPEHGLHPSRVGPREAGIRGAVRCHAARRARGREAVLDVSPGL